MENEGSDRVPLSSLHLEEVPSKVLLRQGAGGGGGGSMTHDMAGTSQDVSLSRRYCPGQPCTNPETT